MDLNSIVAELRKEGDRIGRAIAALVGQGKTARGRKKGLAAPKATTRRKKKRGGITAAGRKRLSMLMKKRWAERRKKGS